MVENLSETRAKYAFDEVSKLKGQLLEKYSSLVRSFPAMILTNGFGLAISFLCLKNEKNEKKVLHEHIQCWLRKQDLLLKEDELMKKIVNSDSDTYRMLETETLALLEWLKRFAEGAKMK